MKIACLSSLLVSVVGYQDINETGIFFDARFSVFILNYAAQEVIKPDAISATALASIKTPSTTHIILTKILLFILILLKFYF